MSGDLDPRNPYDRAKLYDNELKFRDRAAKVNELEDLARQLGHRVDQHDAAVPEPWRMEVLVRGERTWATNSARYRTREQALAAGEDLARRWVLVVAWRAADETVPLREVYVAGSEDGRAER